MKQLPTEMQMNVARARCASTRKSNCAPFHRIEDKRPQQDEILKQFSTQNGTLFEKADQSAKISILVD